MRPRPRPAGGPMPVLTQQRHHPGGEAGCDGVAQRHRRAAARTGRARLAALRPRQGARVPGSGLLVWQMDATIRTDDQTHENYWRQLLRWLVDGVPDRSRRRSDDRTDRAGPAGLVGRRRRRPGIRRGERRRRGGESNSPKGAASTCRCSGPANGMASIARFPDARPRHVPRPGRGHARRQIGRYLCRRSARHAERRG